MYEVRLHSSARKNFLSLPRDVQQRIRTHLHDLQDNPRPMGCRKLQGQEGLYRIRAGDYRVVYEIHDDVLIVLVIRIGLRSIVYRGL